MLKFALKNMAIKRAQIILIVISVVISAGVAVLAFNTSSQVSDGITRNAGYYSAIIGPQGSSTQLAMNTMYFTDKPLGTIPYSVVTDLKQDMRVTQVIPFAMADSYNGFSLVGTTPDYLDGKSVESGEMYSADGSFEVVVGSTVAKLNGLSVGDEIFTSHSAGIEHSTPFTVVGILSETHSVFDKTVFTQLKSIWEVHEEEHEHEHEEGEEHEHEEGEEHEEHDHEEMNGMVCAVLVRTQNPSYAMTLVNDYKDKIITSRDGDSFSLQAIEPMSAVRDVLEDANSTKYIVYVLCAVILIMNIIIISIITLLNMMNSAKEITLMRLIGISMKKINLLYIIENCIIGIISVVLAFAVSRLCLTFMSDYVASMGVVLNMSKVYPAEFAILGGVFIITVLPTIICTGVIARNNQLSEDA